MNYISYKVDKGFFNACFFNILFYYYLWISLNMNISNINLEYEINCYFFQNKTKGIWFKTKKDMGELGKSV